jgi:pimeloyl-ACP methyl ester carboxylesterase
MSEMFYTYSKLDQPQVLRVLFHPRQETRTLPLPDNVVDRNIIVEAGVQVHARFHLAGEGMPSILFFHGNGETVSDYDDIGLFYTRHGINFLAADYRGYGLSQGRPTVTAMLLDAHRILAGVKEWLTAEGYTAPLLVMGRSLGTAAALELAAAHEEDFAGLILESGFATTLPLLMTLGVDVAALGITEEDGFHNVRKISAITKPTLLIHGQYDEIIPLNSAAILQAQSPARAKELQVVPGASHNTIIATAGDIYFSVIRRFCNKVCGIRARRQKKMH